MNLEELVPGDQVRTISGAIAEVVRVPHGGEWIVVRYIEADDPTLIGTEALCHKHQIHALHR
jgi:preprotein translocase subunit YajC